MILNLIIQILYFPSHGLIGILFAKMLILCRKVVKVRLEL